MWRIPSPVLGIPHNLPSTSRPLSEQTRMRNEGAVPQPPLPIPHGPLDAGHPAGLGERHQRVPDVIGTGTPRLPPQRLPRIPDRELGLARSANPPQDTLCPDAALR